MLVWECSEIISNKKALGEKHDVHYRMADIHNKWHLQMSISLTEMLMPSAH